MKIPSDHQIILNVRYALDDALCNVCGRKLDWRQGRHYPAPMPELDAKCCGKPYRMQVSTMMCWEDHKERKRKK